VMVARSAACRTESHTKARGEADGDARERGCLLHMPFTALWIAGLPGRNNTYGRPL
jgi:hypothetical protein